MNELIALSWKLKDYLPIQTHNYTIIITYMDQMMYCPASQE